MIVKVKISPDNKENTMPQLDLFAEITNVYAANAVVHNSDLYAALVAKGAIDAARLSHKTPIGEAGAMHSPVKRQIRWYQQTMRDMGLIRRVPGKKGIWTLTEAAGKKLHKAAPGVKLMGFCTKLGLAIWGSADDVYRYLGEPIDLICSSPPYPLNNPRAYGNPTEHEYTDFICRHMGAAIEALAPGGCIALNLGQDVFEKGLPTRSMYIERLMIALVDRYGLHLLDRIIWENPMRPPGPVQYSSIQRNQLNATYEFVYVFTNDPKRVTADNRRVLQEHSARHQALIAQGGEHRITNYGDGAYQLRHGSFANATPGKIPRNILKYGHRCKDTDQYRRDAKALGLPPHGAVQPLSLASFLVQFLTAPGALVADTFAGTFKTAMASQCNGRRHIGTEIMLPYIRASAERFKCFEGFRMNRLLAHAF